MNRTSVRNISLCLVVTAVCLGALCDPLPGNAQGGTSFVTIGSGATTGLYYPTGLIIAELVNEKRDTYDVRATVESTPGSVFNLQAIEAGYLEFGLVQSDKQYEAVEGSSTSAQGKGPEGDLRAVLSIYHESVVLVAAMDAGIATVADLKGKRVDLGNPRSGHQNALDALESAGLDPNTDIVVVNVRASDAPQLLQDNAIDAFFYTVGHPSALLKEAVSGPRKARFIPLTGPGIDRLMAGRRYYTKTTIPVKKFYPQAANTGDVETFGVLATLCTSAHVPDRAVYAITKAVFENLERLKGLHPAYATLTRRGMLEGLTAPLHPGAIRYYKETGLMK